MASKIFYCPNCNNLDLFEESSTGKKCSVCNYPSFKTNMSADEWTNKTQEEKEQLKKTWSKQSATELSDNDKILFNLRAIEKSARETAKWVKFWSILSLVSAGIVLIVFLVRCA